MGSVHYDRSWGAGAAAAGASSKSDAASFALEQEDWLYPPDSLCDTPSLPRVETGSPYCAALSEGMPSPSAQAQEEKHLLALFADLFPSADFKAGVECDPFHLLSFHLDDGGVGGKDVGDLQRLSSRSLDFGTPEDPFVYDDEISTGMPLLPCGSV